MGSLLAIALGQSVMGFQQHLAGQSLEDPGARFAHGTFVNRDHFAALLEGCYGLALGITLALLARRNWKRWVEGRESAITAVTLLVGAACAAAIVFSYSRIGILVLAVVTASFLLTAFLRNRMAATLLGVAGVLAAFTISAAGLRGLHARFAELIAQHGDPGRLAIWRDTLRAAPDFLWTGCGLGAFPFVFRRSEPYLPLKGIDHAHSDYLELLVELGLPGALLLFGAISYLFLHTLWKLPSAPDRKVRWATFGCLLGAGGIFLHAAVDFPLQVPAVGAIAAVLLGCGRGLVILRRDPSLPQRAAGVLVMAGLAVGGILFAQGHWNHLDAESLAAQAHAAGMQGSLSEADRLSAQALEANPLAAATWIARAEIAETRGNAAEALRMLQLAATLEPYTVRTEWPLANLHMRQGEYAEAARHFGILAASMPEMRATVVEAALTGGLPLPTVAADIVPPNGEVGGEFLIHLVRKQAWPELIPSFDALPAPAKEAIPVPLLRYVFDQTFTANQGNVYLQLWQRLQVAPTSRKNGPSILGPAANSSSADLEAYGLAWTTQPHEGVTTHLRIDDTDGPRIEVKFTEPRNLHYAHLWRDFAVEPGSRYILQAEVRTGGITSSEGIRLLVRSPTRPLVESKPIRRTTLWTKTRLWFRTLKSDHVLRLLLVRYRSNRLDSDIVGSVALRNVRLIPAN